MLWSMPGHSDYSKRHATAIERYNLAFCGAWSSLFAYEDVPSEDEEIK